MKIMCPSFLLFFSFFPLGASQVLQKSLVQSTPHALIPDAQIPKPSFLGSLCLSAVEKREQAIDKERKEEFNKHQTLIQALTDLTQLPEDLIKIIALYNQATFLIQDHCGTLPCSVAAISSGIVAVGCENGTILFVDVGEGRIRDKLTGHKAPVHALGYYAQSSEFASLSSVDGYVPTQLFFAFKENTQPPQRQVTVRAAEQEARGQQDETLRIWQFGWEPLYGPRGFFIDELRARCLFTRELNPDPACANEAEKKRMIEDVATWRAARAKTGIIRERTWTVASERGTLPNAQEQDVVNFWYAEPERAKYLPQGEATSIRLRIVPENHDIVGWESGDVIFVDGTTYKIECLKGHTAAVRVLYSFQAKSGKRYVASGSDDGTIIIWDVETKKYVQTLIGHTAPIKALSLIVSFEGNYLVSVSDDGTLRKWSLDL